MENEPPPPPPQVRIGAEEEGKGVDPPPWQLLLERFRHQEKFLAHIAGGLWMVVVDSGCSLGGC